MRLFTTLLASILLASDHRGGLKVLVSMEKGKILARRTLREVCCDSEVQSLVS